MRCGNAILACAARFALLAPVTFRTLQLADVLPFVRIFRPKVNYIVRRCSNSISVASICGRMRGLQCGKRIIQALYYKARAICTRASRVALIAFIALVAFVALIAFDALKATLALFALNALDALRSSRTPVTLLALQVSGAAAGSGSNGQYCTVPAMRCGNAILACAARFALLAPVTFRTLCACIAFRTFQISGAAAGSRSNGQYCAIPTVRCGNAVLAILTVPAVFAILYVGCCGVGTFCRCGRFLCCSVGGVYGCIGICYGCGCLRYGCVGLFNRACNICHGCVGVGCCGVCGLSCCDNVVQFGVYIGYKVKDTGYSLFLFLGNIAIKAVQNIDVANRRTPFIGKSVLVNARSGNIVFGCACNSGRYALYRPVKKNLTVGQRLVRNLYVGMSVCIGNVHYIAKIAPVNAAVVTCYDKPDALCALSSFGNADSIRLFVAVKVNVHKPQPSFLYCANIPQSISRM